MISDSCLIREYLEAKRVELGCDQILLEKTIKALQLLELLIINGVNLTFKGGTSLILLLDRVQRLSIDIIYLCKNLSDVFACNSFFLSLLNSIPGLFRSTPSSRYFFR